MNLIVVRHGQTVQNASHIVQGQIHGELSKMGKQQAADAALTLKNEHIDIAVSSDLKRCTHTAEYILEFHKSLTLNTSPAFREIHFGIHQNRPSKDFDWSVYDGNDGSMPFKGGESNNDVIKRVIDGVNEIYKKYPNKTVLLVTHGGPVRVIDCSLRGITIKQRFAEATPNATVLRYNINQPLIYPKYI